MVLQTNCCAQQQADKRSNSSNSGGFNKSSAYENELHKHLRVSWEAIGFCGHLQFGCRKSSVIDKGLHLRSSRNSHRWGVSCGGNQHTLTSRATLCLSVCLYRRGRAVENAARPQRLRRFFPGGGPERRADL